MTAPRCQLCEGTFETKAVGDRHACPAIIVDTQIQKANRFWTPYCVLLLIVALVGGGGFLLPALHGVSPEMPFLALAGLFVVVGTLLLLVKSDAPMPSWLNWINPHFRGMESARARRLEAFALYALAAGVLILTLAGVAR